MKRFFGFGQSDPNEISKSVVNIKDEVAHVAKETEDLEVNIRIETKLGDNIRDELSALTTQELDISRQLTDRHREERNQIQDINHASKYVDTITKNIDELSEAKKSLETDIRRKNNEYEKQLKYIESVKEQNVKQWQIKSEALESLYKVIHKLPAKQTSAEEVLKSKQNRLNAIKVNTESLERQIKEMDEKKACLPKSYESNKMTKDFLDPVQVIVRIAQIKYESMYNQKIIDDYLQSQQNVEVQSEYADVEAQSQYGDADQEFPSTFFQSPPQTNKTDDSVMNFFDNAKSPPEGDGGQLFGNFFGSSPSTSNKSEGFNFFK